MLQEAVHEREHRNIALQGSRNSGAALAVAGPLARTLELNQRDSTLKKTVLLAIVLIAAWFFYGNKPADNRSVDRAQPEHVTQSINRGQESPQAASSFRCDGRVYCSQMASRAEAEFFLRNCPNTKMDGDHDGVPCENDSRF